MGSYENLRAFNIRTFRTNEGQEQRGPRPRVYVSKLLQWVDHGYLNALKRALPDEDPWVDQNVYQAEMFEPEFRWHFTKPTLYKHHFWVMAEQMRQIASVDGLERYVMVRDMIETARRRFEKIEDTGMVILDRDSDGSHLPAWLTAVNLFARDRGWR